MKNKTKCYCGHTIYCDCNPLEQPKLEIIEEAAKDFIENTMKFSFASNDTKTQANRMLKCVEFGAKWQQEQEQSNENSWFNEYQEVENYIIKRIGNKFLEATPDKYKTASEATIALLENNWQQEKSYSEEDLHNAFYNGWIYRGDNYTFPKAKKEWIEKFYKI